MKKILSLALSLIMLLSVMPVAYAAEKTVKEAYIDECLKFCVYMSNVYEPRSFGNYVLELLGTDVYDLSRGVIEENEDELPGDTIKLKDMNSEIEEKLAKGEAVIVTDSSDLIKPIVLINALFYNDDIDDFFQNVLSDELYKEMKESESQAFKVLENGGTQAEFDVAVEKFYNIQMATIKHLNGSHNYEAYENMGDGTHKAECWLCEKTEISAHTFSVYVSNNDATEEADGTKTATCDFCDATDTVIDEGSKLGKTGSFFDMIITFFKSLIDKILSLFK